MLCFLVRARAVTLTVLLLASCARPVSTVAVPACPESPPPTKVVASVPPPEPFVLSAPWPEQVRVPLRPLVLSEVKSSSVRDWKPSDFGSAGYALVGVVDYQAFEPQPTKDTPSTIRGVLLATIYEKADPSAYRFSGPAGQPSPVFFTNGHGFQGGARFVSDGRGEEFRRAERKTLDGRTLHIDSASFRPGLPNPWKLKRAAHLVDVEVNGGKGDASNDPSFVITNVRVLDGTEVLPLDLDAVIAVLSTRANLRLKELADEGELRRKAAASTLDEAARVTPREGDGWAYEWAPQPWVTWDDAKRELSILHVQRLPARYEGPTRPVPVHCAPGQPCAQMMATPRFQIDVLQAVRQTVSAAGVLIEEVTFEPQTRVNPVQQ